jgi:hypothetical protein
MEEPERHDLMLTAPAFGHEPQVLTGTDGFLAPREGREKAERGQSPSPTQSAVRPARFPTLIGYG